MQNIVFTLIKCRIKAVREVLLKLTKAAGDDSLPADFLYCGLSLPCARSCDLLKCLLVHEIQISPMLEPLIELGPERARKTIVFLHGLTGTASSVKPVAEYLLHRLPVGAFRFVLPTASKKVVHQLGCLPVHAWFDIRSADLEKGTDSDGVSESSLAVEALLHELMERGTHPKDLYIGGFSQGGVVALVTGLSFNYELGGIFALSSFLPGSEKIQSEFTISTSETPIFFGFGTKDEVIIRELQEKTIKKLEERGNPLLVRSYDFRHEIRSRELDDLTVWLNHS